MRENYSWTWSGANENTRYYSKNEIQKEHLHETICQSFVLGSKASTHKGSLATLWN